MDGEGLQIFQPLHLFQEVGTLLPIQNGIHSYQEVPSVLQVLHGELREHHIQLCSYLLQKKLTYFKAFLLRQ